MSCIKIDNSYLLLVFAFLLSLFPGAGVDLGRMLVYIGDVNQWMRNLNLVMTCIITMMVIVYIIIKTRRGKIYPPNLIFAGFILGILAFIGIYLSWLSANQQAMYWAVNITANVFNIMIALGIIACAYQIMQYCEDGYESFTINSITGVVNIGVVITSAIGSSWLSPFMDKRRYSVSSVGYVCVFVIEYALIFLLLGIQFLMLKKKIPTRKVSASLDRDL